eukprot:CAMPEP_0179072836 /NCGR_PEP_ID=MMETSP0796-20121207/32260_1 /TAXON_ID=73915 /ORGANISM="Pyrodinium bahamense, Strain pbaha01" /LENGTH=440 /DNA_ID=CAMNT_0020770009 /DNA_START=28 /DNA_END=1347 /DNA_ORIENTATION=-
MAKATRAGIFLAVCSMVHYRASASSGGPEESTTNGPASTMAGSPNTRRLRGFGSGDRIHQEPSQSGAHASNTMQRTTTAGCECLQQWNLSGRECGSSCCNIDNDPAGDWCLVADEQCQGKDWGYCAPLPASVVHWTDLDGDDCAAYAANEWCTADGGYGPGWHLEWGTFEDYKFMGLTATSACWQCGSGGAPGANPRPNPTPNCTDANGGEWKDVDGDSCRTYASNDWCTAAGGYGPGWDEAWGTFTDFAAGGLAATSAAAHVGAGKQRHSGAPSLGAHACSSGTTPDASAGHLVATSTTTLSALGAWLQMNSVRGQSGGTASRPLSPLQVQTARTPMMASGETPTVTAAASTPPLAGAPILAGTGLAGAKPGGPSRSLPPGGLSDLGLLRMRRRADASPAQPAVTGGLRRPGALEERCWLDAHGRPAPCHAVSKMAPEP